MKNKLLITLLLSFSLYAYDYLLTGWQMIGVMEKMDNMNNFDNSCVKEVWSYDHKNSNLKSYISNNKENSTLTSLNEAMGIWVKTDNSCQINSESNILNDNNQSKIIEVIYNFDRFKKLYSTYVKNSPIPDINFNDSFVIFFKNSSNTSYSSNIYVKEIRVYSIDEDITYAIMIENFITKNSIKNKPLTDFKFVSIFKGKNVKDISLVENVKIEDSSKYENFIQFNMSINSSELAFEKIYIIDNNFTNNKQIKTRLEVVQNLEIFENTYKDHIYSPDIYNNLASTDFKKNSLIVLFSGAYNYLRDGIEVEKITEYNDYIEIEIHNDLLEKNCITKNLPTSIMAFITIPKTNKEIIFKEYEKIMACANNKN